MSKFPIDAPKQRVIKSLEILGFRVVREKEHISMERNNPDGTKTPLTMPNHPKIKSSTLRTICAQAVFPETTFLRFTEKVDCGLQSKKPSILVDLFVPKV